MNNNQSILILDDSEDFLELVRIYAERICGVSALTARNLKDLENLGDKIFECRLAILDINLGPTEPTGVEIHRWLRDRGFKGKICFLTGHARNYQGVIEAEQLGDTRVFSKPLTPSEFSQIVEENQ
jgi:DNA-binding response OmpR family regulator